MRIKQCSSDYNQRHVHILCSRQDALIRSAVWKATRVAKYHNILKKKKKKWTLF